MCRVANVTEPAKQRRAMYFGSKCAAAQRWVARPSLDREIGDFIAGRTDGEAVLHALYDHVLDEPVPLRLRALLKS